MAEAADAMARFALLRSPPGGELLSLLAEQSVTPDTALRLGTELRRRYPADLVAAAIAQHELRLQARAKFSRAMQMFFPRPGLEQSSSEVVARHRAARYASFERVADLCCGIGGDLLALAQGRLVPPPQGRAVPGRAAQGRSAQCRAAQCRSAKCRAAACWPLTATCCTCGWRRRTPRHTAWNTGSRPRRPMPGTPTWPGSRQCSSTQPGGAAGGGCPPARASHPCAGAWTWPARLPRWESRPRPALRGTPCPRAGNWSSSPSAAT